MVTKAEKKTALGLVGGQFVSGVEEFGESVPNACETQSLLHINLNGLEIESITLAKDLFRNFDAAQAKSPMKSRIEYKQIQLTGYELQAVQEKYVAVFGAVLGAMVEIHSLDMDKLVADFKTAHGIVEEETK